MKKKVNKVLSYFGLSLLYKERILKKRRRKLITDYNKQKKTYSYFRRIASKRDDKIDLLTNELEYYKERNIFLTTRVKNFTEFSPSKLQSWSQNVKQKGRCELCKTKENLTAHHIWAKSKHPTLAYDLSNGVCLCLDCHNAYHKKYPDNANVNLTTYREFYDLCKKHLTVYGFIRYELLFEKDEVEI